MKKTIIALSILFSINLNAQTIKIAAAGNLRYALDDIKTQYAEINPETKVLLTISSSGALFQQISNGARYDIYMAADRIYPEKLKAEGLVYGEVETYGFGKLILWSNTLDVSEGLEVLSLESINRIAVAKPQTAPYGDRAIECLKYYKIYDIFKSKLVYADNIAQAAQFVQTGNAEIGFLAKALVFAPGMKGSYYELDEKSYSPVEQAMVILKGSETKKEVEKFMNFVLSSECKIIFEQYGFIVPLSE